MATARKLPSGSWRVQVFSHKDERGRIIKKSFTCSDPSPKGKRKCEAMATAWAAEKGLNRASGKTFGAAADEYIKIRRNTQSPGRSKTMSARNVSTQRGLTIFV